MGNGTQRPTTKCRMLVDGELIEADSGRTFDNVNPATEEVLGPVADASAAEMHRAIDAARRAFDETDWSTNRDRRKECLAQLQDALEKEREELREELILEVGCPRMTTHANQLDIPLDGALALPDQADRRVRVAHRPGRGRRPAGHANTAPGLEGAGRRRRRHRAVELPARGHAQQARPGAGHRQHGDPQAGAGHAVERHPARAARRRADRLPAGRAQRRDVVGPPRRRGADAVAQGRPDLVHRVRPSVGKRIMEKGAPTLKRVFLELGGKSATIVLDDADFATSVPVGHRGLLPRRAGLRHSDPHAPAPLPLRGGRRDPEGDAGVGRLR